MCVVYKAVVCIQTVHFVIKTSVMYIPCVCTRSMHSNIVSGSYIILHSTDSSSHDQWDMIYRNTIFMAGGPSYEHKFIYLCPSQGWRILKLKEQAVYIQQDIFEPWTVGFFVGKYIGIIPLFIPDEVAKHIKPVAHRVSGYINESRVNYNGNHSCLIYMNEKLCLWLQVYIDLTCFSEQLCKAALYIHYYCHN